MAVVNHVFRGGYQDPSGERGLRLLGRNRVERYIV